MLVAAPPAHAQATRTWVSGVGDDLNPCSRTAPCKTFAGAISKTAAGGEINCLDPGAFGAVTITKALSIICQYTEAGALATLGSNDITVNAGANDAVYLSGLDLQGAGTGLNGVRFIAGASLTIDNSIIRNFGAANGNGVSFQPSGASRLTINRTRIASNGSGATGGGILIQPTGAGGSARVTLNDIDVSDNANVAIRVDTTGNTAAAGVILTMGNSRLNGSTNGLTVTTAVGTSAASANVINSQIFNNQPGSGIVANGGFAFVRATGNTITGNGAALSILNGATIKSYGDNVIDGNSNASGFTPPNQGKL
jgi:hypothetical protein